MREPGVGLFFIFASVLLYTLGVCELCEEENALRLTPTPFINSPDGNVGRLEVCVEGTWGTFNFDSAFNFWPDKNMLVACRQLGFSGGLNSIPPSHIPIEDLSPVNLTVHYGLVVCSGVEDRITSCPSNRESDSGDHFKDVFLVCQPNVVAYSDLHVAGEQLGDVRLFGVITGGAGAVEILTDRFGWTGICPDHWDNRDARIVCQYLGYDFGMAQNFAIGDTPVNRLVGDAVCSDTAHSVSSSRIQAKMCSFQEARNCSERAGVYAGIRCGTRDSSVHNEVRMFGRDLFFSGRAVGVVEVFVDSRWGVVCGNNPARVTARVLCRRLFDDADNADNARPIIIPAVSLRMYESHLKPLWANRFLCPDDTNDFNDCMFEEPLGFANCSSGHVLAVDCGSTLIKRENNETAIIVGVGLTVFVFAIVFFIFGKIMYNLLRKKRTASIATGSFALTGEDLGHAASADVRNNGGGAVNVSYEGEEEDEFKVADDVKAMGSASTTDEEKLTKA